MLPKIFLRHSHDAFKVAVNDMETRPGVVYTLGQGTIYPDVVESAKANNAGDEGGEGGEGSQPTQHLIKSHHNVGGLPEQLGFKRLVEPLRHLFKNEVRDLGKQLGVPESVLQRHPFPGPGLGIRILGKCNTLTTKNANIF